MSNDPQRDIVVYDGECGFCRTQIERLKRWDAHDRFEYTPRNQESLEQRYPNLAEQDFNTGMRVIKPDGTIHAAADAVYEVARQLPGWRWVAWLYGVPGVTQLCRAIYAWIAARRHRLGQVCTSETCPMGKPHRAHGSQHDRAS